MDTAHSKKCGICGHSFTPGPRGAAQAVCSSPDCQHKRQLANMKAWRARKAVSPDNDKWKESCRKSSAEWRKKHQSYLKLYREENKEKHGQYMREYMRKYRESA